MAFLVDCNRPPTTSVLEVAFRSDCAGSRGQSEVTALNGMRVLQNEEKDVDEVSRMRTRMRMKVAIAELAGRKPHQQLRMST